MFLGVDTSCYTTSLAVIDAKGRLLSEARKLLAVPQGERGLRQSDGVFQT
ncbi:N6-L-threonylcarbamoyladenine synthase, partial [Candidatus Hakubella thermalkaliphila]